MIFWMKVLLNIEARRPWETAIFIFKTIKIFGKNKKFSFALYILGHSKYLLKLYLQDFIQIQDFKTMKFF